MSKAVITAYAITFAVLIIILAWSVYALWEASQ